MDNPNVESMNVLDYKAFRKQLVAVVIIGWCTKHKAKVFAKPHKDTVEDKPWDDGNVSYGARVMFRLATEEDKTVAPVISDLDRISKYRHQVGWIADEKVFFDYIIKNPAGFSAGDVTELPNEVLHFDIIAEEDKRRAAEATPTNAAGFDE